MKLCTMYSILPSWALVSLIDPHPPFASQPLPLLSRYRSLLSPPSLSSPSPPSTSHVQATEHEVHVQPHCVPPSNTSPLPSVTGCQATVERNVGLLRPLVLEAWYPRLALILIDAHLATTQQTTQQPTTPKRTTTLTLSKQQTYTCDINPLDTRTFRGLTVNNKFNSIATLLLYFRRSDNYCVIVCIIASLLRTILMFLFSIED